MTEVTTCATNPVSYDIIVVGTTTNLVRYDKSGKCDRSGRNIRPRFPGVVWFELIASHDTCCIYTLC